MKSLLLQLQGLLKTISILDVLDILVVAYFLFRIYLMLKNTRAATLVKGLLVLAVILFISKWLNLHVITWLLEKSMTVVMVALPVVFQPELRRALEQIGRGRLFHKHNELDEKELEDMLNHHQAQDLLSRPSLIFAELYPLVQDNADIVSILIGENGDLNFVNRLKHIVREKCLKDWMALKPLRNSNAFEAYYAFIVSGCIGMVQYWLSSGMKESAEELAYMTENIILNGIRVLEKEAK